MKILIVDDEKSIRFTLCQFLNKEKYETAAADDAMKAIEILRNEPFDIVLTDIIMPRFSGLDLLECIRSEFPDIQVIVMTGEPTLQTAIAAVKSGAADYITKPVSKQKLLHVIGKSAMIKALQDEKAKLEMQNLEYQNNLEFMVLKRTEALQSLINNIIFLLSHVVEVRDPYTAIHQRRVGNLAAAIAKKMNLDSSIANILRVTGYLHDIGKITIPLDLLVKPGTLSELEHSVLRNHVTAGIEILKKVDLPDIILETISQHHERMDGSGYPNSLRDERISLQASILSVADVVESMISHRPYRAALGINAALQEIEKNAEICYRGEVVKACIELFVNDGYSLDDAQHNVSIEL